MIGRTISHFRYSNIAHQKMLKKILKFLTRASYFLLVRHIMLSLCILVWLKRNEHGYE